MSNPVVGEIAVYLAATQVSAGTGVSVPRAIKMVRETIDRGYKRKFVTAETLHALVEDVVAQIGTPSLRWPT